MSRDYKPSSKPASRKRGSSTFTGVVIGLFVGLAIAVVLALFIKRTPTPFVDYPKPAENSPAGLKPLGTEPPRSPSTAPTKPRFDFYTILPGTEEPVTEQEIKQAAKQPTASVKDNYYLQAGSFPDPADADNLKAKLALLGVEALIQTANLPDKGVWHRVRIGPYTNIEDINRVRTTLAQNGIEPSLIKIKDKGAEGAKSR